MRCGGPAARRQVRRSTAAGQARPPRSVPAAVLPRSAPAAAAVGEPVRPPVAVARGHRQAAAEVARRAAAVADVAVETEPMNMKNIKHTLQLVALAGALAMAPLTFAQTAYPTPEAAADALVDGIARHGPHGPPRPGVGPQGDGP